MGESAQDYDNVSRERAAALIVESEQKIRALKGEMEQDEELKSAKAVVKDLRKIYTDAIKQQQAIIQLLLSKIDRISE